MPSECYWVWICRCIMVDHSGLWGALPHIYCDLPSDRTACSTTSYFILCILTGCCKNGQEKSRDLLFIAPAKHDVVTHKAPQKCICNSVLPCHVIYLCNCSSLLVLSPIGSLPVDQLRNIHYLSHLTPLICIKHSYLGFYPCLRIRRRPTF